MSQDIPNRSSSSGHDVWSGMRWTAFAAYAGRLIRVAVGIVLVRLLMPEDYGVVAMAMVVIGFVQILQQLGFYRALVQLKEIDREIISSAFLLNMVLATALMLVIVGASPVIERVYHNDQVGLVAIVLSFNFIISAIGLVPSAMLTRHMRFDLMAAVSLVGAILGGVVSLVMAWTGWGVWSLVAGSLTRTGLFAAGSFLCHPWKPELVIRFEKLKQVLRFGGFLSAFEIVQHFARNSDSFLLGARLGDRLVGFYRVAYGLMLLPYEMITMLISHVLLPALAREQDNDEALRQQYSRTCGIVAFLAFPLLTGLLVLAEPFVSVVYGDKWLPSAPVVMILAPVGMIQSVAALVNVLYQVKGRTDLLFYWGMLWTALYVLAFVIGLAWGILGVATAYLVVSLALFVPMQIPATWLIRGLKLRDILAPVGLHTLNCVIMGGVVFAARLAMESAGFGRVPVLVAGVLLGGAVYAGLNYWSRPPALMDALKLARLSRASWLPDRLKPELVSSRPKEALAREE